jgi:DMSO/TMAO reductase YedYZ molybdopterin-dependent catalytic subunit
MRVDELRDARGELYYFRSAFSRSHMTTRGFTGRRPPRHAAQRLPPGQYQTDDFPVLSMGPTPDVRAADWRFTLHDGPKPLASFKWDEFQALPQTQWHGDIHCVTKWSKFDTDWSGVTIDDLFAAAGVTPPSDFLLAHSYDEYDTNVPVADLVGGRAMIATRYAGAPLTEEHGGPARLLVPHLYFWKSAKWVRGLRFTKEDTAGFWDLRGYHMYGDPWREQRYTDDP